MNPNGCSTALAVSAHGEYRIKVGAAIMKGRRVISVGFNKNKTTPMIKRKICNKTLVDKLHAEMAAILASKADISGTKLYVARTTIYGYGTAKPCNLCMTMIREAGIKEVHYTTPEGWVSERV